jgi:hypothetical protein
LPGHWLFLGAVCSEWEAIYASKAQQQVRTSRVYDLIMLVSCGPKFTLYSAAVASPATAMLASSCGLVTSEKKQLQHIAGLHADLETLTALQELGMPITHWVVEAVALSGRLNDLQHLLTLAGQHCLRPSILSHRAARSGSISMLKWLRKQSWCEFDDYTCTGAARGGHLAALKHLRSEGCDWDLAAIAREAARGGSIEVVEWLRQQQYLEFGPASTALAAAVYAGQTAMCKHLRSLGCEWGADACSHAAECGHFETLRWLRENACPWDVRQICTHAARNGSTDILDYVLEQGEVLDAELLTAALNNAGIYDELLAAQWLRQRGALWPAVLGHEGIQQWSGDVIAWARAEGCDSLNQLLPVTLTAIITAMTAATMIAIMTVRLKLRPSAIAAQHTHQSL